MSDPLSPPRRQGGAAVRRAPFIVPLLAALALLAASASGVDAAASPAPPPAPLPLSSAELMRIPEATILYAVYSASPAAEAVTRDRLFGILNDRFPGAPEGELRPFLEATTGVILAVRHEQGTFGVEFLADFGRGLSPEDLAVFASPRAVIVVGVAGAAGDPRLLRAAGMIAWAVARDVSGALFDPATLECFGERRFKESRVDPPAAGVPPALAHTLVRISRDDAGRVRLATRGMRKFGRPDLMLDGLADAEIDPGTHLLRALAGRLAAADPGPIRGDALILSGADVAAMLAQGAVTASPILPQRTFAVRLLPAERAEHDDPNRIVRVVGADLTPAAALAGAKSVFDVERPITGFFAAGEIEALAAETRRRIPAVLERMPMRGDEEFYLLVLPDTGPESSALVWVKALDATDLAAIVGAVQPGSLHPALSPGDHLTVPLHRCYDYAVMQAGRVTEGDTLRHALYAPGR